MVSLQTVLKAQRSIEGTVLKTPLVRSTALSTSTREVRLKLETLQPTGAFKIRGATNAIAHLTESQAAAGVVCASTGNHGRALAYAATKKGITATICMSELVPKNKVEAIRDMGAAVRIIGRSQDDAQREVDRLVRSEGMTEIPPFDHSDVIAGQGTIGLEIVEDWPEVDTIIVPLSGGGLISGIALAAKSISPEIKIIGVSMARGAAMSESLRCGKPIEVEEMPSLADSLGGGVGLKNEFTFQLVQKLVDDVVLLSEGQIASGLRHLFTHEDLTCEGAAAVGVPVVKEELSSKLGDNVAIIVSGCNVDAALFERVIQGEIPFRD